MSLPPDPKPDVRPGYWAQAVNQLAQQSHAAEAEASWRVPGRTAAVRPLSRPLLTRDEPAAGFGWRMSHGVAEDIVNDGLDPDYLGALAVASGLQPQDLFEFAGIDRTTIGRRKAAGAALPHEAAVKALVATELLAQANAVFGAPAQAARWLTTPHPLLNDETPLRRARTPWGLSKVQGMLVALRYGGAV